MSRSYESNPTLIRPSPELFEKVMRDVRSVFDRLYRSAWDMDFTKTKPYLTDVRSKDGFLKRIRIDSRIGDEMSIEGHGSWFEIAVGPKFIPSKIVEVAGEWAKDRYGSSRGRKIQEETFLMVDKIVRSSRMSSMHWMKHSQEKTVNFFDFSGNQKTLSLFYWTDEARSIGGSVVATKDGAELFIIFPSDWTLETMDNSWSQMKGVVMHELTHAIDPGIGKQKYSGGPNKIIRKFGYDSIRAAHEDELSYLSLGNEWRASRIRKKIEDAFREYHGDPMEIRAEASSILWAVRRRILSDWMPEHHRPMPSSLLWEFIEVVAEQEGKSSWISLMTQRDQGKMLAYIAQALIEEGLVV